MSGYTLDEIKRAFWATFHKSGEVFFNYLGSDEENEASTNDGWVEFSEHLENAAQRNEAEE